MLDGTTVSGIEGTTSEKQLNTRLLLEHAARSHGQQTVVTDTSDGIDVVTYEELWDRVKQAANVLQTLGVSAGDAVGLYGYSTRAYVELIYAISSIGATPFAINLELPPDHQQFCIDHVESNAPLETFFVDDILVSDLAEIVSFDEFQSVVIGDRPEEDDVHPNHSYDTLMADADPSYDFPEVDERTAAFLMFTSGTTGRPKAIAHTHRMAFLHCTGMVASKGLGPQDTYLMVPPLFHGGWFLWGAAPASGSELVLPGKQYPENLPSLLLSEDVTFTAGVPTLFKRVVDIVEQRREQGEEISLNGTEIVFAGQAPPTQLLRDLEALGAMTTQLYGFAEVGPQFAYNVQNHLREQQRQLSEEELLEYKSRVAGYPVPGMDLKLLDEDGEELPWDGESIGELYARSPWGSNSYWKMPEATSEGRHGKHLSLGDLVRIDDDGNIDYQDRKKDMIKSGGEWIPSPLLEDLITEHPSVSEAAVFAAEHEEWMERPIAVVTLTESRDEFEISDLETHLMEYVEDGEIEKWWIPEDMIVLDTIPKTSVGKYNKKVLRDEYGDVLRQS